jgi:hypothetical protein
MNIFVLDKDPAKAAKYHCDTHVVKMTLEYAQLLSIAHRALDGEQVIEVSTTGRKLKRFKHPDPVLDSVLYKTTHANHPCAKWARMSLDNYAWLFNLFEYTASEYTLRYGKVHLSEQKLIRILANPPNNLPDIGMTEFVQTMPEQYQIPGDAVKAYRNLYIHDKSAFAEWRYSETPFWYKNGETK